MSLTVDTDDEVPRPRVTRSAGVIGVLAVIAAFAGGFVAGRVADSDDEPDQAVEVVGADDGASEIAPAT